MHLLNANNDHSGNRNAFASYWFSRRAIVAGAMRDVLIRALTSGKHHIDFWWECSLEDGSDPTVFLAETPGAAHVLFVTDHTPVEPADTEARAPLDEEPAFPAQSAAVPLTGLAAGTGTG